MRASLQGLEDVRKQMVFIDEVLVQEGLYIATFGGHGHSSDTVDAKRPHILRISPCLFPGPYNMGSFTAPALP